MNISPYDNLPTGDKDPKQENPQQAEDLQYVDVPLDELAAEASGEAVPPRQSAEEGAGEITLPEVSPQQGEESSDNEPAAQKDDPRPEENIVENSAAKKAPVKRESPEASPSQAKNREASNISVFAPSSGYSKLSLRNIADTGEYLLPFEETLLVPDTMPDMEKVLFAEGSVLLSQPAKASYRKTDSISGELIIYTVYKPGSDATSPVDVIRSAVAFNTDKCWDTSESDTFRATVSVKSVSAEMLNERKFTVKGTISIHYTGVSQKELTLFNGANDNDLIRRTDSVKAANLIFEADETTEISQEIDIREDQPAPVKILKERFDIVENHRQITSGKLVINGTIISEILYLGQDEDGDTELGCLKNKTDFTQFIIIDKDVDADLLYISFTDDGLKTIIESQNRFQLQGKITSVICGYENMEIPIVSDVYHRKQDIDFDISCQPVSCLEGTVCGEISSREIVNIEEEDSRPETLLCGSGRLTEIQGTAERGKVTIDGMIAVKILALDAEGQPLVIDSQVPLRGALEMAGTSEESTADVSAALKEFWFDSINPRQLEINVSVSIEVRAIGQENFTTVDNLRFIEPSSTRKHISMALYVAGREDTLWDVAKRYKTDVETLSRLNGIDSDHLSEGTKLLIMR